MYTRQLWHTSLPQQRRARANAPATVLRGTECLRPVLYKRRRAPGLDESVAQGVPVAEYDTHR